MTADDIQGKHQQRAQHGDDDDDEGVARGSVGGQRRSSGRGSSGDAAHTALSIGLPSALVLDAMRDVTMRFHSKECKVSALIDSALGADPSNFKKVGTLQLTTLPPTRLSLNSLTTLPSPHSFYPRLIPFFIPLHFLPPSSLFNLPSPSYLLPLYLHYLLFCFSLLTFLPSLLYSHY